jgi:hypothetical protein
MHCGREASTDLYVPLLPHPHTHVRKKHRHYASASVGTQTAASILPGTQTACMHACNSVRDAGLEISFWRSGDARRRGELLPRPFRTEGPLYLNRGEEPLQHEAGAEGLSTPVLNPCGTHRGARVHLWEQARGRPPEVQLHERLSWDRGTGWCQVAWMGVRPLEGARFYEVSGNNPRFRSEGIIPQFHLIPEVGPGAPGTAPSSGALQGGFWLAAGAGLRNHAQDLCV